MQQKFISSKNFSLKRKHNVFLSFCISFPFLLLLFLPLKTEAVLGSVSVFFRCNNLQTLWGCNYSRPNDGADWKFNISNSLNSTGVTYGAGTTGDCGSGGSDPGITWKVKLIRNGVDDAQASGTAPDCSTPSGVCGNSICEGGETHANCPGDCPDITPPSVSITSPSEGATVSDGVTLSANAADPETGISQVQFAVQNSSSGAFTTICTDTFPPYSCSWDTTGFINGPYRVYASAINGAGLTWNRLVNVTVNNAGSCGCTNWVKQGCGKVGCASTEIGYTRACTPSGCDTEKKCVADVTCGAGVCSNECSTSGAKQCTDSTHYKICGNYDTDSCLEWSPTSTACPSSQTCSGGICQGGGGCNAQACAIYGTICCTGSTSCINWTNDPNNCGGCGKKCAAGQICSGGHCGGGTNQPPNTPSKPSGPTSGTTNTSYTFSTSTTDPNRDQIQYGWDWDGNSTVDEWSGLKNSGAADSRSHSWTAENTYNVKVKAKDSKGAESGWSSALTVSITSSGGLTTFKLEVPLYHQDDIQWGTNEFYVLASGQRKPSCIPYQNDNCKLKSTINISGCAPTSAEMILAYYGKGKGVVETANTFTDKGCHRIHGNCPDSNRPYYSKGSDLPYFAPCSGVLTDVGLRYTLVPVTLANIASEIGMGRPVLLSVSSGCYGGTHAMVAIGYEKGVQGNVTKLYVNDPEGQWQELTNPACVEVAMAIKQ